MDRVTSYRDQVPYETDFLNAQRYAYEAFGLLGLDLLGSSALVAGLSCAPTSPASMDVNVGPGRVYTFQVLEPALWGQIAGVGGLAADTAVDHKILKQGIIRDTLPLTITAPATPGQSINYLVQVGFAEADAAGAFRPFYNPANPNSPISNSVSVLRADNCIVQLKAGISAATGSQTTPAPDANFVGVWVVTVTYGATTITAPNIAAYGAAPFVLTQAQILALLTSKFSAANQPTIPDVVGLAAALAGISPNLAQAAIIGLTLSNTVGFTTTRVSVASGTARDNTNTTDLVLASPMTKRLDAVWAAGTNSGGRDSATAVPVNSYYHVHLIWHPTGPVVDVLFSQSATAPTLPSGYTKFRRIGSILTDAAGAIRQFIQIGRRFELVTRTVDLAGGTANGAGVWYLRQLIGVPIGVKVRPIIVLQSTGTLDGNPYLSAYLDPDKGTPPAFGGATQWGQIRRSTFKDNSGASANYGYYVGESEACSASAQVYTGSNDTADSIAVGCLGWIDDLSGFG